MAPFVGTLILSTLALLPHGAVADVARKPLMRTVRASSKQMHIMSGGSTQKEDTETVDGSTNKEAKKNNTEIKQLKSELQAAKKSAKKNKEALQAAKKSAAEIKTTLKTTRLADKEAIEQLKTDLKNAETVLESKQEALQALKDQHAEDPEKRKAWKDSAEAQEVNAAKEIVAKIKKSLKDMKGSVKTAVPQLKTDVKDAAAVKADKRKELKVANERVAEIKKTLKEAKNEQQ